MIPSLDLSNIPTSLSSSALPNKPLERKRLLEPYVVDGVIIPNEYTCSIDWSSIESFTTCDRSSMWKLVYGRIGHRGAALTYGSAVHKGLEEFYMQLQNEQSIDELDFRASVTQQVSDVFLENPTDLLEWRTPELALTTLEKYFKKFSIEDSHWKILHTEQALRLPICSLEVDSVLAFNPELLCTDTSQAFEAEGQQTLYVSKIHYLWSGVIDLVIQENSQTWIIDHKTTSIEGESLWKGYAMSQQFEGYLWAARELGLDPAGIIANVIYSRAPAKSAAAQKSQAEKQFLRQRYFTQQWKLDEWKENMSNILTDFTHNLVTGNFPYKRQWCVGKYGVCPYFDVCSLDKPKRLMMLASGQYEDNTWSPLEK